jgi:hypothetical protein
VSDEPGEEQWRGQARIKPKQHQHHRLRQFLAHGCHFHHAALGLPSPQQRLPSRQAREAQSSHAHSSEAASASACTTQPWKAAWKRGL